MVFQKLAKNSPNWVKTWSTLIKIGHIWTKFGPQMGYWGLFEAMLSQLEPDLGQLEAKLSQPEADLRHLEANWSQLGAIPSQLHPS